MLPVGIVHYRRSGQSAVYTCAGWNPVIQMLRSSVGCQPRSDLDQRNVANLSEPIKYLPFNTNLFIERNLQTLHCTTLVKLERFYIHLQLTSHGPGSFILQK